MRLLASRRSGFTLIELLVVITIIGILATGATATYTSQIQKARDTSRINDLKTLQSATEQYYQDFQVYPGTQSTDITAQIASATGVVRYASKVPKDQKLGQTCARYSAQTAPATVPCGYVYNTASDDNQIEYGAYELSTAFENKGNVDSKAFNDDNGGAYADPATFEPDTKDASRLELGIRVLNGIDSSVTNAFADTGGAATILAAAACGTTTTKVVLASDDAFGADGGPALICGNN